jgi:FixJ family two-component response regulator
MYHSRRQQTLALQNLVTHTHIHLVEDDEPLRSSLERLLSGAGYRVVGYPSAATFLHALQTRTVVDDGRTLVIMDVQLGSTSGIQVQRTVRDQGSQLPFVFISAHQDARNVNQAWQDGAHNFLFKPFMPDDLLQVVTQALDTARSKIKEKTSAAIDAGVLHQFKRLTPRQKEVLKLVASGHSNAEISAQLSISTRTVKMHRASIMHGFGFTHVADLVRFHEACRHML